MSVWPLIKREEEVNRPDVEYPLAFTYYIEALSTSSSGWVVPPPPIHPLSYWGQQKLGAGPSTYITAAAIVSLLK